MIVAGGSGLIGKELVKLLSARSDVSVISLVRKLSGLNLPNVSEQTFAFDKHESYEKLGSEIPCDLFYSCLGTTIKTAGSAEAFQKVDRDYPLRALQTLQKTSSKPIFSFVSSIGADKPRGLYLKTKWEVEQALAQSSLPTVIVRPSLLLGNRKEFRLGEKLATTLAVPFFDLTLALVKNPPEFLANIAPIEAIQVARVLISSTLDEPSAGHVVVQGKGLFEA